MKTGQRLALIIYVFFLALLGTPPLLAESQPVLRVAVPENYPPFYYRDADGQYKGASYEIVSHISDKLGYQLKVTQLANLRVVLAEMAAGNQDMNINLTPTPGRREVALFTQTPHIYESQNLIARADNEIEFDGELFDLARYRFGPIYGWTYGPQFDKADFLQKEYVNDTEHQLKGLLAGHYDFALNNPQFFQILAAELKVANAVQVISPPVYTLPVSIAVSREHPNAAALVAAFERELRALKQQPLYRDILIRYGFDKLAQSMEQQP